MRNRVSTLLGVLSICLVAAGSGAVAQETRWFAAYEGQSVSPDISRDDTPRLVEVGTVATDGFSELRISIAGEFKEAVPRSGTVGAILIPDINPFVYLLEQEGKIVFATEVKVPVGGQPGAIFFSEAVPEKIAFPAYRIYLYNDTSSAANVNVYVYRVRL
jgi:hypothetical protein